MVHYTSYIYLE